MRPLTDQEVGDWRDGKLDHERARIVGHLAACDACAARLAAAVRDVDVSVAPVYMGDVQAFVETGLRAGPQPRQRRLTPVWLGLAATLVAVIGGALLLVSRPPMADAVRGAASTPVVLKAPIGVISVGDVMRFTWTGTSGPVRLLVIDLDGSSEPLVDEEVTGTAFGLPAGPRARFVPGRAYRWLLEYADETGAVRSTPAAGFSVRDERQ